MSRFLAHTLCRVLELSFGIAALWIGATIGRYLFH